MAKTTSKQNMAASVRARLLNLASNDGQRYGRLELLYLQERFLARLSATGYRNHLVLKGGLFLYSQFLEKARPTRDIDFLGSAIPAEPAVLDVAFREIAAVDIEDGARFDTGKLSMQKIKEGAEYEGQRVQLMGYLGSARQPISIDIGFGDAVTPAATALNFPVLLDHSVPQLLAYSLETVVAEKFHAMVYLGVINTRYKDFDDLYRIASSQTFTSALLLRAIGRTFERRNTALADRAMLFEAEYRSDSNRQKQWLAFGRKNAAVAPVDFSQLMLLLKDWLEPLLLGDNQNRHWSPSDWRWVADNQ
jgi:predicted nucleotidyltransferase component of viral defense system